MSVENGRDDTRQDILDAASDLDFDKVIDMIPYARYLGVEARLEGDELQLKLPYRETLVGNASLPALHGGVVAGFLENAALARLFISERNGRVPQPIDFSIDFLRSAKARDLYATCHVQRLGRRVAQVQAKCWQSDPDQPVAVARAHFLLKSRE